MREQALQYIETSDVVENDDMFWTYVQDGDMGKACQRLEELYLDEDPGLGSLLADLLW